MNGKGKSIFVILAFLTLSLSITAFAAPVGASPQYSVFVGYGDNDHAGSNFPSIWCGDSGVQFIGSGGDYNGNPTAASNCTGTFDGGAIMVQNTGASSLTISGLTVTLPAPGADCNSNGCGGTDSGATCGGIARPVTWDIWFGAIDFRGTSTVAYTGGTITVAPGDYAIFTGTTGGGNCPGGPAPTTGEADFDTSDSNFLFNCPPTPTTDTQSAPQITLTIDGAAQPTLTDAGHTIDTGGQDPGNCGINEALGWRPITVTCGESCPSNQIPPTLGVPQFALPTIAVAAIGLVAFAFAARLMRRGPPTIPRQITNS
ncbi:MAG: hypothetical protein OK456_10050 [Thaumarchaeota archaeon]|nr:hypothetical protein [Nitrososphaerota archaeon]